MRGGLFRGEKDHYTNYQIQLFMEGRMAKKSRAEKNAASLVARRKAFRKIRRRSKKGGKEKRKKKN